MDNGREQVTDRSKSRHVAAEDDHLFRRGRWLGKIDASNRVALDAFQGDERDFAVLRTALRQSQAARRFRPVVTSA